jgi:DNA-binding PadR family transcriptional regulator
MRENFEPPGRSRQRRPDFGFFGPHRWHPHAHGGGRARRGDVRAAILALLAEKPMHGYEIIRELGDRSRGVWQPSPGSVYPTLQLLEDEGLIRGVDDAGKRRFELTDEGRAHLAANPRLNAPWEDVLRGVDPVQVQLRDAVKHVALATHQVAEVGTEEQRAEAARLLAETRRQLYVLLASSPSESEQGPAAQEPPAGS